MTYCSILITAREKLGISVEDAAKSAGLSKANYYDLEAHENELTVCFSLQEIFRLCRVLKLAPSDLFGSGRAAGAGRSPITCPEIAERIRAHCREQNFSIAAFEDKVGWAANKILSQPEKMMEEWNVDCFKAVCAELKLDWRQAITDLNLQSSSGDLVR